MHDVPSGLISINVSFAGTQIYEEVDDLCSKTTCPIKTGPIDITYVQDLPPIAPPVRTPLVSCSCLHTPCFRTALPVVSIKCSAATNSNSVSLWRGALLCNMLHAKYHHTHCILYFLHIIRFGCKRPDLRLAFVAP